MDVFPVDCSPRNTTLTFDFILVTEDTDALSFCIGIALFIFLKAQNISLMFLDIKLLFDLIYKVPLFIIIVL